jgi:hypothetical protein
MALSSVIARGQRGRPNFWAALAALVEASISKEIIFDHAESSRKL